MAAKRGICPFLQTVQSVSFALSEIDNFGYAICGLRRESRRAKAEQDSNAQLVSSPNAAAIKDEYHRRL
jgi:hypothetical protein